MNSLKIQLVRLKVKNQINISIPVWKVQNYLYFLKYQINGDILYICAKSFNNYGEIYY